MDIALMLLTNLLPLYALIAVGFFAGKRLRIDRETLANFAIFICVPVVFFGYVAQLEFQPAYILLPVIVYGISTIVAFGALAIGTRVYGDNRANLMSMCAAMGNSGYFGLPVVLLLFDAQWVAVYMFMLLGFSVFEGTIGYYIAARGNFTVRDSIIKVLKFPTIYAIAAGLAANFMHVELPQLFLTYWAYFKGCYVICGMMIIGVALSKAGFVFAPRFVLLSFAGKFIAWPLLTLAFILSDNAWFHLFPEQVHILMVIISLVPQAANIAAFAAQLDLKPEKAATTILAGTVFALFYIPAIFMIFDIRPIF